MKALFFLNNLNNRFHTIPELRDHLKNTQNPPKIRYYNLGSKLGNIFHLQLRVGRSNLNEHRFQIGLSNNPGCECSAKSENTKHFVLKCPKYDHIRNTLLDELKEIIPTKLSRISQPALLDILLHGLPESENSGIHQKNKIIAKSFQTFLLKSKRLGHK